MCEIEPPALLLLWPHGFPIWVVLLLRKNVAGGPVCIEWEARWRTVQSGESHCLAQEICWLACGQPTSCAQRACNRSFQPIARIVMAPVDPVTENIWCNHTQTHAKGGP